MSTILAFHTLLCYGGCLSFVDFCRDGNRVRMGRWMLLVFDWILFECLVLLCAVLSGSWRTILLWSWVRVFIDIHIANGAQALLQDRVLVLCCVGTWHDDVVVVLVAMDGCRDRAVRILEDSLDDVDALLLQKILHGLDVVVRSAVSVDNPMTFRKQRSCACVSSLLLLMLMLTRVRRRCIGSGSSFCRCTRAYLPWNPCVWASWEDKCDNLFLKQLPPSEHRCLCCCWELHPGTRIFRQAWSGCCDLLLARLLLFEDNNMLRLDSTVRVDTVVLISSCQSMLSISFVVSLVFPIWWWWAFVHHVRVCTDGWSGWWWWCRGRCSLHHFGDISWRCVGVVFYIQFTTRGCASEKLYSKHP